MSSGPDPKGEVERLAKMCAAAARYIESVNGQHDICAQDCWHAARGEWDEMTIDLDQIPMKRVVPAEDDQNE